MQFAREAGALFFVRLDDTPNRVAADALAKIDCDRGALSEGFREAQVLVTKARIIALAVVSDHDADRSTLDDERDVEAGAEPFCANERLVDLGIFGKHVDALARRPRDDTSYLRRVEIEPRVEEVRSVIAFGGCDPRPSYSVEQDDERDACPDQVPESSGDDSQHDLELDLGGNRVADLVEGLELSQPAGRRFV